MVAVSLSVVGVAMESKHVIETDFVRLTIALPAIASHLQSFKTDNKIE